MNESILLDSLKEAEAEHQRLWKEVKRLDAVRARQIQLYHLILQLRMTLGLEPYQQPPDDPEPEPQPTTGGAVTPRSPEPFVVTEMKALSISPLENGLGLKRPIWKYVQDVMTNQPGRAFSLDEIMENLRSFGVALQGRIGKESVRSILFKKRNIFSKDAEGRYLLKK
ncbi:MAG TPA: hypothetical protein VHW09_17980 [Bryobacteraceae bacterium]|nr:hypothetical protein [Bryobacteraceae bacterium]